MKNPTSPMSEISGNKDIRENVFFTMVSSLQYHHLPLLPHWLATLSSALNKQQQNFNCVAQFFFANNYFLIEKHS